MGLALLGASSPAIGDPPMSHEDFAPIGLTASLDNVPTLVPVSVPEPYRLEWQSRLQDFEASFEARQAGQNRLDVDPIETGSISAEH